MNYMNTNFHSMSEDDSDDKILTMAFVNIQPLSSVYDVVNGFSCGTIFPNLDKPLRVGGAYR